jgi:hypothetical protein
MDSQIEGFCGTSSKNTVEHWSRVLLNETRAHKMLCQIIAMSTAAVLLAIVRVTSLLP